MEAQTISQKISEYHKSQIKVWPCHVNRASNAGHPCERFLVYSRTAWNQKALHDEGLQTIFEEGRLHEDAVIDLLKKSGLDIVEQQRPFEWKEIELTGHIDGKILDGVAIPFEIKSMSPYSFDKINSVEDMLNSKYVYMRGYPVQMWLYLLMNNSEKGFFILKQKATGQIKVIEINLDYEKAEKIVKKLENVNAHIKAGTLPDRIKDVDVCSDCNYSHICLPDLKFSGIEAGDDRLLELLQTKEELETEIKTSGIKDKEKELEAIKKNIKEMTEGKEQVMIGDYYLTGKWVDRKGFEVKPVKYWSYSVKRI